MNYTEWKNLPDRSTPITAENLLNDINNLRVEIKNIVESGINGSESYIKLSDGTMIIYGTYNDLNANFTRLGDALFYYHSSEITFKSEFIDVPSFVLCSSEKSDDDSNLAIFNGFEKPTTNNKIYPRFIRPNDSSFNLFIRYFAIGKWK